MPILATVICPIRNEEQYIAQCLESLTDQTFDAEKMEILVVDGMSTDKTRDIVGEFQKRFSNIKLLDNPKQMTPAALNIGVQAASGDFILRMDGHAKAARDYVEKCVEALKTRSVECVGGPIISVNKSETGKAIALAMSSPFGVGNSRFRTSTTECFVDSLAFPAFKREVFKRYGLFDEELVRCQDDEFNFRIRRFGGKILLTPTIKSWYFPRADFRRLWRQYFGYGFWKIRVFQKNPLQMRLRHFVPASLVFILLLSAAIWLLIPPAKWFFLSIAAFYSVSALAAAWSVSLKNPDIPLLKIILSFLILHFSYGSGFLFGLARFARRWFEKEVAPEAGITQPQT